MTGQRTRKSHHGCFQCKRRSVKCDEKRPQCSNCDNRRDTCCYATSGPLLWAETGGECYTKRQEMMMSSPEQGIPNNYSHDIVTHHACHKTSTMIQFNISHLKLLLNWTTSTCRSISRNHADSQVWQSIIPQQALSCPYLMHGIFAVSALHLALSGDFHGNERHALIETAELHQSEAIKMFTKQVDQMAPLEYNASFALSSLLIGFAFAFPLSVATQHQTQFSSLDELIEVFILIRKMNNFSTPMIDNVQKSELGGLLLVEQSQSSLSESSQLAIKALRELLNAVSSPTYGDYHVFADTIDCLENLLTELDGAAEMVSRSFIWICEVPVAFIDCLQGYNSFALMPL
ncbi:hypothetical protein BDV26DRAFT_275237 [Aspergillus bertholletiae]|uniref:Zn(2)-C6 fungal-type domain-containing protein n=1 Tax=Aspergillus bertholletiae TaxID=1226010 RepID=A0A5N7AT14_9EURO|nr:hypothetical protein BDV26DRAFT_275237 [Aspergillus bertholletiae]